MDDAIPFSLSNLPVEGKKVLMRVDFNVPINDEGVITDDTRLQATIPSIEYVLNQGGALILMSHLGRPKGKESSLSLAPIAEKLGSLLQKKIIMASDCVEEEVEKLAKNLVPGQILLLENLRFHKGEEKPEEEPDFAEKLSRLGDCYVNDAFGTAHRAHSSTALIASFFPGRCAAGFLLEKEVHFFNTILKKAAYPFMAIVGGAKVSTKIGVLKALFHKVDKLFIGGGMAYTFLKAKGMEIGNSLFEEKSQEAVEGLLALEKKHPGKLFFPIDFVVTQKIQEGAESKVVTVEEGIPSGYEGVDMGPATLAFFIKELSAAKTIFWNGPVGVFEWPPFDKGTNALAQALAKMSATTIVGGGDSVAAVQQAKLAPYFSHISTGGGASLEYIEYGTLPGITALINNR